MYHAKRYDDAAAEYRRVIDRLEKQKRSPELREVLRESRLVLSAIEVERGELGRAEETLLWVLDEFPDDIGAMNDLGYLWADQNKHLHRAARMVRRAVEAEPDNAAYRDSLGWVYYRQGRYTDAVSELEEAVKLGAPAAVSESGETVTPDPIILDHLGDAYAAAGRTDKALQTWSRAAELFQDQGHPDQAATVRRKIKRAKKPPPLPPQS